MTVGNICHTAWDAQGHTHVCGKEPNHSSWHLCACGELLMLGRIDITDEVMFWRSVDCPDCLARAGRPCVHRKDHGSDLVMAGVHETRRRKAEQQERKQRRLSG